MKYYGNLTFSFCFPKIAFVFFFTKETGTVCTWLVKYRKTMLPNVAAGADYQDYFADSTAFNSRLSNFVVIATSPGCIKINILRKNNLLVRQKKTL